MGADVELGRQQWNVRKAARDLVCDLSLGLQVEGGGGGEEEASASISSTPRICHLLDKAGAHVPRHGRRASGCRSKSRPQDGRWWGSRISSEICGLVRRNDSDSGKWRWQERQWRLLVLTLAQTLSCVNSTLGNVPTAELRVN